MQEKRNAVMVNQKYKDTFFRILFRDKKALLSLYNALNDSHYEKEEELEIVTLEGCVYMGMKNDLAFILDYHLYLYEHQSTVNPNLPLRDLFYVSQEYQKLLEEQSKSLYSSVGVRIPALRFVVFYNGRASQPERQILKLSDLYQYQEENPMLELQVLMLNINHGHNEWLKEKCTTLKEYMEYVERVRYYTDERKLELSEAVNKAVEECIQEGILEEFLRRNKAEAIMVSLFEYNEEEEMQRLIAAEREDAESKGREKGRLEGHAQAQEENVKILIEALKKWNISRDDMIKTLMDTYALKPEDAEEKLSRYWL